MPKTRRNIYFLLLIVATIASIVLGINYSNHLQKMDIINNGIETMAYVEDGYSNTRINGVYYYYLNYIFTDENGVEHYGRTSAKYREAEANYYVNEVEYIKIKYNSKFESIEADYNGGKGVTIAFFIVIGVDALLVALIVVSSIKAQKLRKIGKIGTLTTATLVDARTNLSVNGVPKYFMIYNYKDENGNLKTGKTGSSYYYNEIAYFRAKQIFDIRYQGDKSVVVEKAYSKELGRPSLNIDEEFNFDDHNDLPSTREQEGHIEIDIRNDIGGLDEYEQIGHARLEEKETLCEHCAANIPAGARKCPNCGAKVQKHR